jgi:hypothetical protein
MSQIVPGKILAGTKVARGIYKCNACANEYESKEEEEVLPICSACDSISWRNLRLSDDSKRK